MTRAMIFDFFGVISSEVAPFWFEKYFPPEEAKKLKEELTHPVDIGEISQEEFFINLGKNAGVSSKQAEEEFYSFVSIDNNVINLIKELKGKYKIGLCSNASATFLRDILKRNDLEELFDAIVISSDIGVTKPDPHIYKEVLSQLQVLPNETVFIDDNLINVKGSEEVGMKGILFNSLEQLQTDLEALSSNTDQ